jgi:tetratricopeptide (TPR) repeat protein
VLLVVALLLLGPPAGARNAAADKTKAREAFREALRHYNLSEFKEALASFKAAYRAYDDPSFLFNIGQCQRQLGLKQDALHSYKAYLRESPEARNGAEVLRLIAVLETTLEPAETPRHASLTLVEPIPPPRVPLDNAAAPPPTPVPATTPPARTELVSTATAPPHKSPIYKRWWLWTTVGVVAAGAAAGVAIAATRPAAVNYPAVTSTNGTLHF